MNGVEFLLSLLCIVFINSCGVDCIAPKPKIQLIPRENNFIEGKPTTFICHIEGSPTDAKVTWLIRDRTTRTSTFIASNFTRMRKTASVSLPPGHKSTFAPLMRRDFDDMEVVCRTADCLEDSFRIPVIERTISIEEVRFGSRHQVRGRKLRVYCDVLAEPGMVKRVFFRVPVSMDQASENRSLGNGWIRFTPEAAATNIAEPSLYNGWPIQCFAVTKDERKNFGNVMSPITTFIVHYLEFRETSLSSRSVTLGKNVTVALKVAAHPRPPKEQFFIVRADGKDGGESNWTKAVKVNVLDVDLFDVQVQFAPQISGTYKIVYEAAVQKENGESLFSNSTQSFTLEVFCPRFLDYKSHWHEKVLDRPRLFTVDVQLSTRREPKRKQLLLLRYYKGRKIEEAEQTLTRIIKLRKNLYRIEMSVSHPKSGTYVPVFKSGSLNVFGPAVRIVVREESNAGFAALVMVLLVLLLLLALAICLFCQRKGTEKLYKGVPVRIVTAYETASYMAKSTRSWAQNLLDFRVVDPRASKFIKVAVNEMPVSAWSSHPRSGDQLTFVAPTSLRLLVVRATSWKPVHECTLPLHNGDTTWGAVRQRVQDAVGDVPVLDECTAYLFGRYYAPEKLALRIYEDGEIFYRDELTCEEVPRSNTRMYMWKFLTPRSYFRWPQGSCPVVELRTNTRMLLWRCGEPPTPLSDNDLIRVVAFVQMLADNKEDRFVRLYDGDYFHYENSRTFNDYDLVIQQHPDVPAEGWKREFLFFKEGEELPTWQVPAGKQLIVFVREGLTLKIKGRRLVVSRNNSARLTESEWVAPFTSDEFQKSFSDTVRGRVPSVIEYVHTDGTTVQVPVQPGVHVTPSHQPLAQNVPSVIEYVHTDDTTVQVPVQPGVHVTPSHQPLGDTTALLEEEEDDAV